MKRPFWRIFLFILGICLLPKPVLAHGGGDLQVTAEPVGPHIVSVWTNPSRAKAGEVVHVTVGVGEQGERSFVLDAEVLVEVFVEGESPNAGATAVISTTATTDRSTNKLFYETDFVLPEASLYTVVVTVSNSAGSGEVAFDMPVGAADNQWFGLIGVVALALVGLLIAFSRYQKAETAVSSPRRPQSQPK